jgi:CheY-like chemotaxis protein
MSKILIVEDHADTAQIFATLLRRAGHAVEVAAGYHEALRAAQTILPEVMVCDIGLPDGDGCDLLRELRQQFNLAGVAVTGYVQESDRQRYLSAGFDQVVPKPCSFQELQSAIASAQRPPATET